MKNRENLRKLATKGILWMATSQFSSQFIRFIVTIILARLLFPEDFGLMGLASIFIGVIIAVHELGLGSAIIQRKDIDNDHLSTAFWASIVSGILFCLLTILASPFVANFFHEHRVQPILLTLSFVFIIGSFSTVPWAILTKNLEFKKIAISELFADIIAGVIAILMALLNFGVWSLVWRMLLGNVVDMALLWILCKWRPSILFDFKKFGELFGFSVNVTCSRALNFAQSNIDNLIIGKVLGATALGYYSIAYNFITFPLRRVSWVITRVTFPTFSLIQDDNEEIRKGYLRIIRYISIIVLLAISILFIISPEFVVLIIGEKWTPMIPPLQILCIAGATRAVVNISNDILLAKGRPDIQLKWNIVTLILLTIAILIGVNYGIVGVAVAVTLIIILTHSVIQIIANRLIDLDIKSYLEAIYPAVVSSLVMVVFIFIFKEILYYQSISQVCIFVFSIVFAIPIYLITLKFTWRDIMSDIKLIYNDLIRR